jgi:phenylpropionate dioxygenase-like ring-hydroxylating dioxygenase large terminal subunit
LSTGWVEGDTIRCRYHGWLWRRELGLLAAGKPMTPFGTPDPQALRQEELEAMGFNA